jgi:hypothetical protein
VVVIWGITGMRVGENQITEMLRSRGLCDVASQVGNTLPGRFDTDNRQHHGLLSKPGLR